MKNIMITDSEERIHEQIRIIIDSPDSITKNVELPFYEYAPSEISNPSVTIKERMGIR